MKGGGRKAKRSGRKAVLIGRSQGQYGPGTRHAALPLWLTRERPRGGPPRFGTQVVPALGLGLTVPRRMGLPRMRGWLRFRKPQLAARRPIAKFLERPQRIGRHQAVGGLGCERTLSRRCLARQRHQGHSHAGANKSDPAHFGAPGVIRQTHERHDSRIGRLHHPRRTTIGLILRVSRSDASRRMRPQPHGEEPRRGAASRPIDHRTSIFTSLEGGR
jgi:hypothetical protein